MIQDIAPHRLRIEYIREASPAPESPVFLFEEGRLLFIKEEEGYRLPKKKELIRDYRMTFLFRLDGEACFLAEEDPCGSIPGAGDPGEDAPGEKKEAKAPKAELPGNASVPEDEGDPASEKEGAAAPGALAGEGKPRSEEIIRICDKTKYVDVEYITQKALRGMESLPREIIFAAWTAGQLSRWYAANRFCGTCGSRTVHGSLERSLVCSGCGRTIYPRINPAIIAAVTNGDEVVLTRYRGARGTFNALVAGFVEIGETLEDTVRREVMEETGLRVRNLRYYRSQPWSIADDLLAGFFCDVDGPTKIHMDADELGSAIWTRREDVVLQPDDASLTNEMMKLFRDGKEPR